MLLNVCNTICKLDIMFCKRICRLFDQMRPANTTLGYIVYKLYISFIYVLYVLMCVWVCGC